MNRISFLKTAETGAITDSMNLIGVSGWMSGIFPADKNMKICGQAFTVEFSTVDDPTQKTYNIFEVIDLCKTGDVMVVAAGDDGSVVGENIMNALWSKGIAGMVLDGKTRDYGIISKSNIPHFSCGADIRLSTKLKIVAFQKPISCGGVIVSPGDYIIGDTDGVISLSESVVDDVIYQCEMVAQVESEMELAIRCGIEMQDLIKISQKKKTPRQ